MGHRPSTSDSLPVVGNFGQFENMWGCFGHQHLGLTAGPKTGRWLAQLMVGETPNTDIARYSPNRF
jgi:D-amino-acid dehydrogenase